MFTQKIAAFNWERLCNEILQTTAAEVESLLSGTYTTQYPAKHFSTLISPAAAPFLEEMMQLSQRITQERFGKNMQLFIPM